MRSIDTNFFIFLIWRFFWICVVALSYGCNHSAVAADENEVTDMASGNQSSANVIIHRGGYEIIYSADENMCSYVQDRLDNYIPHPEALINPFSNDPFASIKWNLVPGPYYSGGIADFDIDNDGELNTVINLGTHFRDLEVTSIKVFKLGTNVREQKLRDLNKLPEYSGSINLTGLIYCLDKCKEKDTCKDFTSNDMELLKKGSPEWCPSASINLLPFLHEGKTFIAFRGGPHEPPLENNWVVVSEYMGGHIEGNGRPVGEPRTNKDMFKDMCYLKK